MRERDINVTVFMCVHADADGPAHTTEEKVFDDFRVTCAVHRLCLLSGPPVFFVRMGP